MPKSKRDKKVSLTQTKKKGSDLKKKLVEDIQQCVNDYSHIFTFSVQNMRNSKIKDVRQEWSHSRFFFGKNKVMAIALGRNREDEFRPGLNKLGRKLLGQMGLLFTNKSEDEVLEFFSGYVEMEFARAGNTASQTVIASAGPLMAFSHDIEPQLRRLGLTTCLERGVVTLMKDFTVCEKDKQLTPEQAQILKLFGYKTAQFFVTIESMWSNGKFRTFSHKQPTKSVLPCVRIKPVSRVGQEVTCEVEAATETDMDC